MKVNGKNIRTVWMDKTVKMIDQRLIPHKLKILSLKRYQDVAEAIKSMAVRGAPAIGAAAGFGLALAATTYSGTSISELKKRLNTAKKAIERTRPTAHDLFDALDYVFKCTEKTSILTIKKQAILLSNKYADKSVQRCKLIGENGERVILTKSNILTHCNAGALATVDYGTALAPIRAAKKSGKKIFVFVDETRPRCQGARLTAWELLQEKIPHAVIADNSAGHFMQNGKISLCIVGADRIAMNGDTANKIGTYEKAVLAKENNIPFYIAAPLSTFDRSSKSGKDIIIEERNPEEVTHMWGQVNGKIETIRIAPKGSPALNPSFDITPSKYITGIITEKGIIKPNKKEIARLLG